MMILDSGLLFWATLYIYDDFFCPDRTAVEFSPFC